MAEGFISTDAKSVWPDALNVVLDLIGSYTLYLDVGGAAKEVLRFSSTTNGLVMVLASSPAGDLDWDAEVVAYGFKNGEQLHIYGIKITPAPTGEFDSAKTGG